MRWAIILGLVSITLQAPAADIVGWRLDGNGLFPPQRIATAWDDASGKHIRWRTPMPNWSNSSPIVVGDRVFCMAEPTGWAPILLCLDADSGEIRWQREVDHLSGMSGGAAVAREYGEMCELIRTLVGLLCEHAWYDRHDVPADDPRRADLAERVQRYQASYEVADIAKGDMDVYSPLLDPYVGKQQRWMEEYGVAQMRLTAEGKRGRSKANAYLYHGYEDRNGGTTWIGKTWPTPLCDGERVYVVTGFNTVAAYDLEGDPQWIRFLGYPAKERRKELGIRSWPKQHFVYSPIWSDGKLITYTARMVTAFEPQSGKILWQVPVPRWTMHQNNDLQAMDIDGLAVIAHPGGLVLRSSDGARLADLPKVGKGGGNFLARGDVVYTRGIATRLLRDGDGLRTEVVWQWPDAPTGMGDGHGTDGVVAADHLILSSGNIELFRLDDGQRVGRVNNVPSSGCSLAMTGPLVVTGRWRSDKGEPMENPPGLFAVTDVAKEQVAGRGTLHLAEPTGDKLQQIWRHGAIDGWRMFGAATPFIADGRIYIRSFDHLICIE